MAGPIRIFYEVIDAWKRRQMRLSDARTMLQYRQRRRPHLQLETWPRRAMCD